MKSLSVKEAEQIFGQMMSGAMPEHDIAEFLLALKEKGETANEILGAAKVMREKSTKVKAPAGAIDVCGTGGDGLNTLNISTAVALVVAGAGVPVAKHGNKAVSSTSGSADVLGELGVNTNATKEQAEKSFASANMAFLFAPNFHPAMKIVAPVRARLKTKTIFNLVGPLANPAETEFQLIGVSSPHLLRIFAEVLRQLGAKKAWVVNGVDGLDEISITGETQVAELANGAIDIFTISPEDFGSTRYLLEEIKGGDARTNAMAIERLLEGEKGAYREIVLLNAAAALLVAGKVESLEEGMKLARESIDSGKAQNVLDKLREIAE